MSRIDLAFGRAHSPGALLPGLCLVLAGCASAPLEPEARGAGRVQDNEARGHRALETSVAPATGTVVLTGGVVLTASGERHSLGHVIWTDGRLTAVSAGPAPTVAGAHVIDATGMVITPGLIDTHTHMGVYPSPRAKAHSDGNEMTNPVTPGVWAEHAFWPQDPGIERAVAGGTTTAMVLPGSGNLIGGRGVTLHLVPHRGSRAMRFPGARDGLKMACGENPKRIYGGRNQSPQTRMGNLRGQRMAFHKAAAHLKKLREGEEAPDRDLNLETLVGALEGKVLVHVHCYRSDDMLNMMQLADEVGFQIRSFHHGLEAYKIRDLLAEHEIAVSTWADWWGFKLEAYDGIQETPALLAESGARAIIHSDSARGIQRLNQEASKAMWSGRHAGIDVSDDEALKWITAHPAWALGIEDEVGTLEVGKRADVVVWDADPFSVYARPQWVFVDGHLRFDRQETSDPWSDFELGQEVGR